MLHIALCDAQAQQRQLTRRLLDDYAADRRLAVKAQSFACGRALLNAVAEGGPFDLYLLEVVMPEMDGIELGVALRQVDRDGAIIYLTASPDFALESYRARAFFYLLKPAGRETLFGLLDEVADARDRRHGDSVQVKTRGGRVRLLRDDILYAELRARAVRYYLRDGSWVDSMTTAGSFRAAVSPLLADGRFLLCGASFAVNLYYVKLVHKSGVVFSDGRALELPKAACTALRRAWSDYWGER